MPASSSPPTVPERRRLADPPPVEVDEVAIGVVGTLAWAVATVVLALLHGTLSRHHDLWWLWTAVAGTGLGIIGTGYLVRRRARANRSGAGRPAG